MRQEVNLYQPIFRKQRKVFSAVAIFQVAGLVLAGLVTIYLWGQWQGRMLEEEVVRMEERRDNSQQRLQQIQREMPARTPSPALEREQERLETRLQQRRRVAEFLAEGEMGVATGFSGHFAGLARQRQDGMWLNSLRLYGGGRQMDLTGVALAERLVPQYVQKLSEEEVFAGTEFRRVELRRSEDAPQQILFELRSRVPEDQGGQRR